MRKIIILLLLLCLHFSARGQTQYEYRYWFDGDMNTAEKGSTTSDAWRMEVDLSRLTESFHTIHLQVTDEKGVSSSPVTRCFFLSHEGGTLTKGYYWFDNEVQVREIESNIQGTLTFDVTELPQGFHSLHYQVLRADGLYSQIETRSFYKLQSDQVVGKLTFMCYIDGTTFKQETVSAENGKATWILDVSDLPIGVHKLQVRAIMENGSSTTNREAFFLRSVMPSELSAMTCLCSIDGEVFKQETMEATNGSAIWQLDVSELPIGFHKIQLRAVMENGASTSIREAFFLRAATEAEQDSLTCICSIDGKVFKQETIQATNGGALWQLDVSELPIGFHKLQLRAVMGKGGSTSIRESFFLRNAMDSELEALACVFSIDGQPYKTVESGVREGVFHFDLDVAALSDGLHKIAYILTNGKGDQTTVKSQYFIKQPVGGNSIKMYQYWLNDKDDMAHTVKQEKVTNPLQLISLLPVESQLLRSSMFHFEMKDGQPMMYAKNEFHARFYDNSGRWVDADDQYIDYNVGQEVTNITNLLPTQTINRPDSNSVKWFSFDVAPGDTAAFRLSQPATLQVFAPSGAEVFNTSESASVEWGGIHTWEDGTYYLAVHDVTGSKETMTLEYMHMDKYDVVDWDVHRVGNGGCSTITFKGNGFRDLYAVDLFTEHGDSVHYVYIGHESDATTSVVFDFTDAALGTYHAKFRFAEEDKVLNNIVTVEEARSIELAINVKNPSTFLRGSEVTYTIDIINSGNSTAYNVPIEIQLLTDGKDAISKVRFSDNIPDLEISWLDNSEISEDSIIAIQNYIKSNGDMLHFISVYDSNEKRYFKDSHFALNIAPNSTFKITISIVSNETIELQALIPGQWAFYTTDFDYSLSPHSLSPHSLSRRASFKENACCVRETVECLLNLVVGALDFASFIPQVKLADCIASLGNTTFQFAYDVWCGEEHGGKDMRNAAKDLVWDAINGIIGCAIPGGEKWMGLQWTQWVYQHIYDNISNTMDCVTALTQKIPNCPPNPDGGGGSSTPVNSCEPNDILGYVAESGSKAIKEGHTDVFYTIQFENDTIFATAPAHDIYLTDTLDVNQFDLSTYRPTRITIGNKSMELTGERNFISTMDMRPEINAIAQIEGTIDDKTGIVRWHISSLDPMTMEPSDDPMVGVLPVNFDGSGLGEASFDISLKPNLADGTIIPNRSGNVFDNNETVLTPTWVNTVDAVAPQSTILGGIQRTDSTLILRLAGEDERSGVWKYAVYAQAGSEASWELVAENVTDTLCEVRVFDGIDYGFCVLGTDSAGNVERKTLEREFELATFLPGDANGDGVVNSTDAQLVVNYYLGKTVYLNFAAADVVTDGQLNSVDAQAIQNIYLNSTQQKQLLPRRARMRKQRAANAEVYSHE